MYKCFIPSHWRNDDGRDWDIEGISESIVSIHCTDLNNYIYTLTEDLWAQEPVHVYLVLEHADTKETHDSGTC